ncbi:thioredoxin domain-containing protein [Pedobacter fastidiosus]|uniref:Thioredoxin domain-containing protein n=1 Tax=Pedobacter fastidiosus TaxID=2765361 RepID=A0ABR7KR95_9SPHI|nr:thioredoxin domain-containing protein [Pedobacter fastidiosus]MBC6110621.1 thioredoxin domain-containing protein [Pedobacter fastidiosus]
MANLFSRSKPNAVAVIELLLKTLNVKVSKTSIKTTLEEHPYFPSILSVSESLTDWYIENQVYQINKEEYNSDDLLFPLIAHLNVNGGVFILIHEINNKQIAYSNEIYSRVLMHEADFLKIWSGIALHAIAKTISGEKTYQINKIKDKFNFAKTPLLITLIIVFVFLDLNYNALSVGYVILLSLKFIGLVVSTLLLMYSINASNPLIQNLCSLGKKNNCNSILKSDAAKVTSWLTWSEVGFCYFICSLLSLRLIPSSIHILAWLNVFALPYTVYSINYQYKNKNWCILCCTVQLLLILEFVANIFTFDFFNIQLSPTLATSILLAFIFPILGWSLIKPVLMKAESANSLKQQLKKFKYNSTLFIQALKSQPKYNVSDELMPIALGNPNAETTITMVSNPFCGPCAKAHQLLDDLLSYRDDIKVKIIFSTADHDDDRRTKVSRHISALGLIKDTAFVQRALNNWYQQSSRNYEQWAIKYPIENNHSLNEVTRIQKAWCELTEITFTPTIFINGYKLPNPYQFEDIKYLLD